MKIEITNTYCKILDNLNIDQLSTIQQFCSFKVEGADFKANAYAHRRRGGYEWDGYKKLFNAQTKKFPVGLLQLVMEELGKHGVSIELVDKRKKTDNKIDISASNYGDRQYQYNAVLQSVINGNGIVKAATGSGKTTIAARTIDAIKVRTIFIVHTKDLLYQTKEAFQRMLGWNIGQIGDGVIDYRDITVATMQTLSILGSIEMKSYKYDEDGNKDEQKIELDKQKAEEFNKYRNSVGCVMMDEVQIVCSQTAFAVRFLFEYANYAFGYSASPWRDDGSDLMIEAAFGKRICNISASELIRDGYLVKPIITVIENKSCVYSGDNYEKVYKSAIVENVFRNMMVIDRARMHYELGRNTLILVTLLKHGTTLETMMKSMGIDVQFISGKSSTKKRKQAIDDMRSGKKQILIASTIADVGLDIPRLDAVVEAGAGKSSVTALQRVGRIMRPFDGKTICYYDTFCDHVPYISEHIERKKEIWRQESEFIIVEQE